MAQTTAAFCTGNGVTNYADSLLNPKTPSALPARKAGDTEYDVPVLLPPRALRRLREPKTLRAFASLREILLPIGLAGTQRSSGSRKDAKARRRDKLNPPLAM